MGENYLQPHQNYPFTAVVAPIRSVAVLSGTHGNEMSGIFLHRFWKTEAGRKELRRDAVEVKTVLTNELAVERCVRYVDVDLNRSHKKEYLSVNEENEDERTNLPDGTNNTQTDNVPNKTMDEPTKLPHEAGVVVRMMRELGHGKTDIALDLHNTTANTGVMLILR